MKRLGLATYSLARREIIRFLRQRSRVVGALAPPLLFWLLLGSGFGGRLAAGGAGNSMQYFYPGTLLLVVLFTAIFSTISIIEDRREGFLQSVLVAPAPRLAIALGKIGGGALLGWGQGAMLLLLAPAAGIHAGGVNLLCAALLLLVLAVGMTGLGFIIAWRLDSTQGFHALMNLLLMPMWMLSGALFPLDSAPPWLRFVMHCNPLTYGLAALRRLLWADMPAAAGLPAMPLSLAVVAAATLLALAASAWLARRSVGAEAV